jgi:hypothetical protein
LYFVIHLNGGAIPQLENARADNLLAGIDARDNAHLVAARALDLNELLAHSAV